MNSPIGSIDEKRSVAVQGTGGKIRHAGKFSESNPYLEQLEQAFNNQDKDALYELAIQWEADYANLQEQREYDDPINQVARQRAAGINPDLTGSSGSGSGSASSGSSAQIADQQGQTKFSNSYDTANTWFNGINAAANFVGSLTGAYGNIISGISQLRTLPSQIALSEAQAGLASANANEVNTLLEGRKKALDLDNTTRYMQQVVNLQDMLKNGFTDEEGNTLFDTVGIPMDQREQLMKSIRGVHSNPALLEKFHTDSLNARKAQVANQAYDYKTLTDMMDIQKETELMQLQFDRADAALMSSIQVALSEDANYLNDIVSTEKSSVEAGSIQSTVALQNAQRDMESWGRLWDEKADMLKYAKGHLDAIKASALLDKQWTEEERSNYNTAWVHYMALRDGLSTEFNQMRGRFIEILQKRWESASLIDDKGGLVNMDFIGAVQHFSNVNFDDGFTALPSGGEIVRGWFNTAIYGLDVASRFAQANAIRNMNRGIQQKSRTSTTESLYNSKTGEWIPQKRTTIDYTNNPAYKKPKN